MRRQAVSHCRGNEIDNLCRSRTNSEASQNAVGFRVEQTFDSHLFALDSAEIVIGKEWTVPGQRFDLEPGILGFVLGPADARNRRIGV